MKIVNLIAIAIGGAGGAFLRYKLNVSLLHSYYPVGTLVENVLGSFLLGLLTAYFLHKTPKEWVKLGLGVGVCGGFTTFSTLAADVIDLSLHMSLLSSLLYIVLSLFGGVGSALTGYVLGAELGRRKKGVIVR
ncbi:CrcB family protein [Bacillus sp. CGMCC 1.16541]|uniref:FluC/FEX family fluoride channel n=1 Tax=Bacillus sp. CGMCC 1.16541 TaxID=2185143 RepID=UPI000D731F30|nr:CrcB family protein [Bacillus sp. CGMCC 1.16541]